MHALGDPFFELQSIDSTNNYAMRQVHAGVARHGFAVLAHEQTAGKGQRQKQWHAEAGKNLMLSAVVEPAPLFATPQFLFSMGMAVAVHELLKKWVPVQIKWPNDVYIDDRKAGGILIENVLSGAHWKFAIVGIGLNLNQTAFGNLQQKAVSLTQITGAIYDPAMVAKDLCREIDGVLKKLVSAPQDVAATYRQHLYKKTQRVKLKQGNRVFEAQIIDVNDSGQLVVQHAIEETFDVGAVEWLL